LLYVDELFPVVKKRGNPDYQQISGYIPVELAKKFKIACTMRSLDQSEAIEAAIERWVEEGENEKSK